MEVPGSRGIGKQDEQGMVVVEQAGSVSTTPQDVRDEMIRLFQRYTIPCDDVLLDKIFGEGFTHFDEFADLDVTSVKSNLGLNLRTASIICKTATREKQRMQPILQRIGELDPIDHHLIPPMREGITIHKIARLVNALTDLESVKLYEHRHGSYIKLSEEEDARAVYLVQHQRVIYFWDMTEPYSSKSLRMDASFNDIADPAPYDDAFEALQRMTGIRLTSSHRRHLEGFEYASIRQMLRKNELALKDCQELIARLNQTIKTYTAQTLWSSTRMILLDRISHRNAGVSLHCVLYPEKFGTVVKVAKAGPEHIIRKEWDTCQEIHSRVNVPSLVKFEAVTQGRVNSEQDSESRCIIVMPYYGALSQIERMELEYKTQFETTIIRIVASLVAAAWGCALARYYHGDIKPANIVLPTDKCVNSAAILIDLGSATPIGHSLARRTPEWGLGISGGIAYDKACIASSALSLMLPHWHPDDLENIHPSGAIKYVQNVVPESSILRDLLLATLRNEEYEAIWAILMRVTELHADLEAIKPTLLEGRAAEYKVEYGTEPPSQVVT